MLLSFPSFHHSPLPQPKTVKEPWHPGVEFFCHLDWLKWKKEYFSDSLRFQNCLLQPHATPGLHGVRIIVYIFSLFEISAFFDEIHVCHIQLSLQIFKYWNHRLSPSFTGLALRTGNEIFFKFKSQVRPAGGQTHLRRALSQRVPRLYLSLPVDLSSWLYQKNTSRFLAALPRADSFNGCKHKLAAK